MNVLRNFFYPRLQPCVVSPIAKATDRATGSDSDGRARQAAVIPLPKPEVEKELRFAKRTVNGLVGHLRAPSADGAQDRRGRAKYSLRAKSVLLLGP